MRVTYANQEKWGRWWGGGRGRAIELFDTNKAKIHNNYVRIKISTANEPTNELWNAGDAIRSWSTDCEIFNNLIHGGQCGISAPYGVRAYNNYFYNSEGTYLGTRERDGVVAVDSMGAKPIGDPKIVAGINVDLGQKPQFETDSPLIDAGHADPIYNDLDGTRNDIGPWGGPWYDPEGWTTDKPVVISFDMGPQRLQEGVDTEVTISNGQAVAQP